MPLYEFKCPDCGTTIDMPTTKAPVCECGSIMTRVYRFGTVGMPTRAGMRMGRTSVRPKTQHLKDANEQG